MRNSMKFFALIGLAAVTVQAAVVQLTFEGLKNQEQVADYYSGGRGGGRYDENGVKYADGASTGGQNYGVSFGGNSLAVIAEDAPGGTGRFANQPSGVTVLSFNNVLKSNSYMNVAGGFTTGISFWYSQPFYPIVVRVYDGLNGTGKLLATMNLPQSATNCPLDKMKNSVANCWTPVGASFNGIAKSVDFTDANFSAFDNLTIGEAVTVPYPPTTPPVSSCPIQNGVKSFILEHKLDAFSFISAFIPNFAPEQIGVFFDPTKEIHTHFEYKDTEPGVVRAWSIPLPLGAPPVTPQGTNFEGMAIAKAVLKVDKIYTTCSPRPAIMVTGPVLESTPVYGPMVGLPHAIAFSFDPSIAVNNAANVSTTNAGTVTILGNVGTVIVVGAPKTSTPSIVLSGASSNAVQQVFGNPYVVDASMSTDTSGSALTYQWSSTNPVAFTPSATSASPTIIFQAKGGDYPITLTVTNAAGGSSKANFTLQYLGRQ